MPRSGITIARRARLSRRYAALVGIRSQPEVSLRSTSGFYEFAFVKLLASVFSSVSRMRLSAEGSRI
jgi:hypothetical protein